MAYNVYLLEEIRKQCLLLGFDRTYSVAFSGGMDSHVLLHLLAVLRKQYVFQLQAIYIHHGLSPNADQWAAHCASICAALNVEFTTKKVVIANVAGVSLEDAARAQRYAVLSGMLASDDVLFTAHHQDDQSETVLLQLLRGAGPKGLAAMPKIKPLGKGIQCRPLLYFPRTLLQDYALQNQLTWIEDESNSDHHFSRNFIRQEVMPILKKRWPRMSATFARSAEHCAEMQALVTEIAAADFLLTQGSQKSTLSITRLFTLSPVRRRHVIRYWLQQLNFSLPSAVKLWQIEHEMLVARIDKCPVVKWQGVELRRYRDDLYVLPPRGKHASEQTWQWHIEEPLWIKGVGKLYSTLKIGEGLRKELSPLTVRFRQGGEVCQLPLRNCHHDLKKLLQQWQIPPWERNRIPLIYVGDQLAAVAGFFVGSQFAARAGEEGYLPWVVAS